MLRFMLLDCNVGEHSPRNVSTLFRTLPTVLFRQNSSLTKWLLLVAVH